MSIFHSIKKYVRFYFAFKLHYIRARMANRYDFFLYIFCDFIIQLAGVVFFYALFNNIPSLSGWEAGEALLVFGVFQLSYGVFGLLFSGLYDFGDRLVSGAFDGTLMRPAGSLFQELCRGMGDIGGVALGSMLLIGSIVSGVFRPTFSNIAMLAVFIVCGALLYVCLYSVVASASFYMERSSLGILPLLSIASDFSKYPLDIYSRGVKAVLTWFLPLGFVGFYPASWFLQKEFGGYMLFLPVVVVVFLAITFFLWKQGIIRYRGAGS